ncbi:MAG: hypothetical protein KDB82_18795 [Planctomycetes bacterium]|nr:hypothetical protein [Planctomycetota bacterium]
MAHPLDKKPDNNIADAAASQVLKMLFKVALVVGFGLAVVVGHYLSRALGVSTKSDWDLWISAAIGIGLFAIFGVVIYFGLVRPRKKTPSK